MVDRQGLYITSLPSRQWIKLCQIILQPTGSSGKIPKVVLIELPLSSEIPRSGPSSRQQPDYGDLLCLKINTTMRWKLKCDASKPNNGPLPLATPNGSMPARPAAADCPRWNLPCVNTAPQTGPAPDPPGNGQESWCIPSTHALPPAPHRIAPFMITHFKPHPPAINS